MPFRAGAWIQVSDLQASWPREPEARRRGRLTVVPEERSRRLSPWSWGPVRHWRHRSLPERLPVYPGQDRRLVGPVASEQPRQTEHRWLDGPARTVPGPVWVVPLVPYSVPRAQRPTSIRAWHQRVAPGTTRHGKVIAFVAERGTAHTTCCQRDGQHRISKPCHDQILSRPYMSRENQSGPGSARGSWSGRELWQDRQIRSASAAVTPDCLLRSSASCTPDDESNSHPLASPPDRQCGADHSDPGEGQLGPVDGRTDGCGNSSGTGRMTLRHVMDLVMCSYTSEHATRPLSLCAVSLATLRSCPARPDKRP